MERVNARSTLQISHVHLPRHNKFSNPTGNEQTVTTHLHIEHITRKVEYVYTIINLQIFIFTPSSSNLGLHTHRCRISTKSNDDKKDITNLLHSKKPC